MLARGELSVSAESIEARTAEVEAIGWCLRAPMIATRVPEQ
jgi:hypothetical protein